MDYHRDAECTIHDSTHDSIMDDSSGATNPFTLTAHIPDKRKFKGTLTLEQGDLQIIYKNIPVMPRDSEYARKWLEECLMLDLEKSYMTKEEYDAKKYYYTSHTPLAFYKEHINRDDEIFFDSLRSENPLSFWHSYATRDLMPSVSNPTITKGKLSSFSLAHSKSITLQEIADKMRLDDRIPNAIIYIDRYIVLLCNINVRNALYRLWLWVVLYSQILHY